MKRATVIVVVTMVFAAGSFWLWRARQPRMTVSLDGRPITAFRLVGFGPHSDEYDDSIAEQRELSRAEADRIAASLADESNFSGRGARCFTPGMAFKFGPSADAQHALICLECKKIGFRRGGNWSFRGLSKDGLRAYDPLRGTVPKRIATGHRDHADRAVTVGSINAQTESRPTAGRPTG